MNLKKNDEHTRFENKHTNRLITAFVLLDLEKFCYADTAWGRMRLKKIYYNQI